MIRSFLSDGAQVELGAIPIDSVVPLSWKAAHPDWPGVRSLPLLGFMAFVPIVAAPVATPDLSWKSVFPDQVPGRQPQTHSGYALTIRPTDTPLLSWSPTFPDRIVRRAQAPEGLSALTRTFVAAVVTPLSWSPHYPSFIHRKVKRTEGFLYTPTPDAPNTPITVAIGRGGSSDILGGGETLLRGTVLDMSTVADDFSGSTLSVLWTNISAGTGRIDARPADNSLQFDTGRTVNSDATMITSATYTNIDVGIEFRPSLVDSPRTAVTTYEFTLYVGATTQARMVVENTRKTRTLRVVVTGGGVVLSDTRRTIETTASGGGTALRWVRLGTRTIGLADGVIVVDINWLDTAASVLVSVTNDNAIPSRAVVGLYNYKRIAVVSIAGQPVTNVVDSRIALITVSAPEAPDLLHGFYDIVVYGALGTVTLPLAFEYTFDGRSVIGRDIAKTLTDLRFP